MRNLTNKVAAEAKANEPPPTPNPADNANRIATARKKRLARGGVQSTYTAGGSAGAPSAPAPTVTGMSV